MQCLTSPAAQQRLWVQTANVEATSLWQLLFSCSSEAWLMVQGRVRYVVDTAHDLQVKEDHVFVGGHRLRADVLVTARMPRVTAAIPCVSPVIGLSTALLLCQPTTTNEQMLLSRHGVNGISCQRRLQVIS